MTDLKCIRCGANLIAANQVCNFCTIEMDSMRPNLTRSPIFQPFEPRPVGVATSGSIEPFDSVGDALQPTSRLFVENLWFITKLVFVIVAPLELLKWFGAGSMETDWQFQTGTFLLQALANVIIAPALIFGLMKAMQTGETPGVNQSLRWGLGKVVKLGWTVLLSWIIITLGLAFCVVPGVLFAVALALVYPLAVLEKGSVLDVLRDSQKLTEGHRWDIFLCFIVVYGLTAVMSAGLGQFALFGAADYGLVWTLPLAALITAILDQAPTVLFLVLYLSIRQTLERQQSQ